MIKVQINKYHIIILDSVLELISQYKQDKTRIPEAGGILLGQVNDDNIYIMKASVPTSDDVATRTSFHRNKRNAQIIVNYEFENSNKKTIYLGEWHTHPERYPSPSNVDKKMISDQFSDNQLNEPFLVFIIQGTSGLFVGFASQEGIKGININE